MYCPSCGEGIEDQAKFCEHCGTTVEDAGTTPARDPQTEIETVGQEPPSNTGGQAQGPPPREEGGAQGTAAHAQAGQVAGGLDPNVAAALSYVLGVITGLVFFLIEDENQFVRFHAAQSMVVFGALVVLNIGLSIFVGVFAAISGFLALLNLLSSLVALVGLVLWIILIFKAYSGEWYRVPVAADIADGLV